MIIVDVLTTVKITTVKVNISMFKNHICG